MLTLISTLTLTLTLTLILSLTLTLTLTLTFTPFLQIRAIFTHKGLTNVYISPVTTVVSARSIASLMTSRLSMAVWSYYDRCGDGLRSALQLVVRSLFRGPWLYTVKRFRCKITEVAVLRTATMFYIQQRCTVHQRRRGISAKNLPLSKVERWWFYSAKICSGSRGRNNTKDEWTENRTVT